MGRSAIEDSTGGAPVSPLISLLRCLRCGADVILEEIVAREGFAGLGPDGWLSCTACGERYPLIGGTARMLRGRSRAEVERRYPQSPLWSAAATDSSGDRIEERTAADHPELDVKQRTAASFAYEWRAFGAPRSEWRKNFLDYMRPHGPEFFNGKLVLDVGAGSGRHSAQAAAMGARVVAVDLGASIDVARGNLPSDVLTVQADAEELPFAPASFDFVMSIGVLHHLPDTERAFRRLSAYVVPGGHLHVYLYWVPPRRWHRLALRGVSAARWLTVRLPHRVLHALSYPLACVLWLFFVMPYRLLRNKGRLGGLAEQLPLQTYADYPFGVLVNDQFDRFSAPIERRFTDQQVKAMFAEAGLAEVTTLPNYGWVADGRRPAEP